MKILMVILILTTIHGNDEIQDRLTKIAGEQYSVKAFDTGQYTITKKSPCLGVAIFPSMPPFDENDSITPFIILTPVRLRPHEKLEDIESINAHLLRKCKDLEPLIETIPHSVDSKGGKRYDYKPRNKDDINILAEYETLRMGIRPVPKYNVKCWHYDVHTLDYQFNDKTDESVFNGIWDQLNSTTQPIE
jgi:hypothetical protein